eukprot:CAMPEP_0117610532 /NCGR_PEP_ID=MMETSP0784-20121206/81920_1 /TAXON_ID=39447 /ORGANISM="" /LENGTH=143 /DNA_ID=CAMNT_0005413935 /DNA_START=710 /DNA_END=1138 /DNA_ORIENTATION=+
MWLADLTLSAFSAFSAFSGFSASTTLSAFSDFPLGAVRSEVSISSNGGEGAMLAELQDLARDLSPCVDRSDFTCSFSSKLFALRAFRSFSFALSSDLEVLPVSLALVLPVAFSLSSGLGVLPVSLALAWLLVFSLSLGVLPVS